MTTILVDDSGCPVLDLNGNLLFCSNTAEMRQRIVNIFSTPKGSETLFQEYGFDQIALLRAPSFVDKRLLVHNLILDAVNPRLVSTIKQLLEVDIRIEDSTIKVALNILGSDNIDYNSTFDVMGDV